MFERGESKGGREGGREEGRARERERETRVSEISQTYSNHPTYPFNE